MLTGIQYEEQKTCLFYARGYCRRGHECWFKHIDADVVEGTPTTRQAGRTLVADEGPQCGICFEEKPALYGLLGV